jgi:DNA-binding CsgD family transcriptional regulator
MGGRARGAAVPAAAERATDAAGVFAGVSARLRRTVPYDAAVWAATDPETGLITAPMVVEGLGDRERCAEYWESELLEEDVLPFRELARARVPAAGLRAATDDLPARCARYRRLLQHQGVHDELRAVVRAGDRPWAVVSLFRTSGAPFGRDDVDLVASLSTPLAARLRRLARPSPDAAPAGAPGPGLVVFDQGGEATSINDAARAHLASLPDGPSVPSALGVRLPIWVVGTVLGVLVAEAYELTPRELQVAQEVARGLPTGAIAARLVISPHTVRDHVEAIFEKTAVSSRGELVARLLSEHYWPCTRN